MLGPFDLANETGYAGQPQHPQVKRMYAPVLKAALECKMDVVASLFSPDPDLMAAEKRDWIKAGARILVAGSDRRMLFNALGQRLKALRDTNG